MACQEWVVVTDSKTIMTSLFKNKQAKNFKKYTKKKNIKYAQIKNVLALYLNFFLLIMFSFFFSNINILESSIDNKKNSYNQIYIFIHKKYLLFENLKCSRNFNF